MCCVQGKKRGGKNQQHVSFGIFVLNLKKKKKSRLLFSCPFSAVLEIGLVIIKHFEVE